VKFARAATDESMTECQTPARLGETVHRRSNSRLCGRFGDFFRCPAPYECQHNRACLRRWMTLCELQKDAFALPNS
jgi:hypothetical protein